jgi:hypothetical protein
MLDLRDAATFTSQDRSTQEVARTSAAVATVPVQLPHHVHWRLRRRLVQPLYRFRPSANHEEVLGDRHIFEGREVLSSEAESRYVALSCNTKQQRCGFKQWNSLPTTGYNSMRNAMTADQVPLHACLVWR